VGLLSQLIHLVKEFLVMGGTELGIVSVLDLSQALFIHQFQFFLPDFGADLVHLLHDLQVFVDVLGSDHMSSFEHHVFKQMRKACNAGPLVDGADAGNPAGGDVGIALARHH
jgi:hypothetical protein